LGESEERIIIGGRQNRLSKISGYSPSTCDLQGMVIRSRLKGPPCGILLGSVEGRKRGVREKRERSLKNLGSERPRCPSWCGLLFNENRYPLLNGIGLVSNWFNSRGGKISLRGGKLFFSGPSKTPEMKRWGHQKRESKPWKKVHSEKKHGQKGYIGGLYIGKKKIVNNTVKEGL